jgi:hypothetical protein
MPVDAPFAPCLRPGMESRLGGLRRTAMRTTDGRFRCSIAALA